MVSKVYNKNGVHTELMASNYVDIMYSGITQHSILYAKYILADNNYGIKYISVTTIMTMHALLIVQFYAS